MKIQPSSLHDGNTSCRRTEAAPHTKAALAPLMPLFWAVMLVFSIFRAQASVVFTNIHSFQVFTNGQYPSGLAAGSDGNFYGTTGGGGTNGYGTVFKITTNGSLTTLYSFTGGTDGADPPTGLALGIDGSFYGTTYSGGTNNFGTVFKITTNGTLTALYSFTGGNDGANPQAGLVQGSEGSFYGTTGTGGTNNWGTVFKIDTNGVLTSLYSFTGGNDGANPYAGLVQGSHSILYGTTGEGGTNSAGTVFQITTNGIFASLYSFTGGNDGGYPFAALAQGSDGYFYSTTYNGGTNGFGTVFKIGTNGVLASLYSFTNGYDGSNPNAGLVQANDGYFYSTAYSGGTNGFGTVFKIGTNGMLTSLYSFTGGNDGGYLPAGLTQGSDGYLYGATSTGGTGGGRGTLFKISTNGALATLYSFIGGGDGAQPACELMQASDGNLYSTTQGGGTNGLGTVYKISTNGVLTSLYSFTGGYDGSNPEAGLEQGRDGNFYGTTSTGGTNHLGTVFKINAVGSLTRLYSFNGSSDGAQPQAGLVQANDGFLYGTTEHGGAKGFGTVFKISTNGALTSLLSFSNGNDGGLPYAALIQGVDGNLYGTTGAGGTNNWGTVFKITTNGALTSLYSFTGGNDGANPYEALVQDSDGYLYSTSYIGGTNDAGTVFRITTNGAFTGLYSFPGIATARNPNGLARGNDGQFYGTTRLGGAHHGEGTIFRINTNGTLSTLYTFTGGNNGGYPSVGVIQANEGSFYGTTGGGGAGGVGTVFRLTVTRSAPVFQALTLANSTLAFTWSADPGDTCQLQFNTNLSSTNWTSLGSAVTATGTTLNANDSITNGPRRFYRAVLLP